ncbi:BACON domain-containing carbohydrate-binding protein [Parabacteroides sp. PF5-9]|uniref:BACON domain-containing protein n=1 Tax=Parabacteroides sp. PF5-9 TaxID=1742404 RepID=UPI0024765F8A|nr:BACON domain-containing carbohydrate-binding protein [Parabacteroides sp. PF5-9]MDH6357974.1 Leucine-rich repeat (LRR) protein [Parabacteroides sp. PF5-9]
MNTTILRFACSLFLICGLCASCSNNDDSIVEIPEGGEIINIEDNLMVYADETVATLRFEATGNWELELLKNTDGALPDWVTVDKKRGAAGMHTITFTLALNYTGEDRSARMQLTAVNSLYETSLLQMGKTKEGVVLQDPNDEDNEDILLFITDKGFREYLLSTAYVKDGQLTRANAKRITSFDLSNNKYLESLDGITYFPNLKNLFCGYTNLSSLDLSGLTKLEQLRVGNTKISELNISHLKQLQVLYCDNTSISELDVKELTNLEVIDVSDTQVSVLEIGNLAKLQTLMCANTNIAELEIAQAVDLTLLTCSNTPISKLAVDHLSYLQYLECGNTLISELNVSKLTRLKRLFCNNTAVQTLDISNCRDLEHFDATDCPNLKQVYVWWDGGTNNIPTQFYDDWAGCLFRVPSTTHVIKK